MVAIRGHHCEVDDRMKAGAYVWVIADKQKVLHIVYSGFGKNLAESLRFLSLVEMWTLATSPAKSQPEDLSTPREGDRNTLEELFSSYGRIRLVQFEQDGQNREEWWGNRSDGKQGVSHFAEGVIIEEFRKRSKNDELFKYCLNELRGFREYTKFKGRDFQFYLDVIEKKIADRDCLVFTKEDFDQMANEIRQNAQFKHVLSGTILSMLTKDSHARNLPNFREMIKILKDLNKKKDTQFSSMPVCI